MNDHLPVQWHTGMVLLAQHFQQHHKYQHNQLVAALDCLGYDLYGVIDIKYELIDTRLRINALHAFLPMLTWIKIDEEDASQYLDIDISEPGNIYLVMPTDQVLNQQSYVPVVTEPIADDFDSTSQETITKLKPNIKLIISDKPIAKHFCLKLFESDGSAITDYLYPFLKWNLGSSLWQQLDGLRVRIGNKLAYLSKQDKVSLESLAFVRAGLVAGLLGFEEQLQAHRHPYDVFKALLNLIAHMITTQTIQRFTYDHDNIKASFTQCLTYAHNILDSIHERYNQVAFQQHDFMWKIPLNSLQKYGGYYICSAHMIENYEVLDDWINSARIATESIFDQIVSSRVLGANRQILDYVEELQVKSLKDSIFFKIKLHPDFIKERDEFLIIYNNKRKAHAPDRIIGYS